MYMKIKQHIPSTMYVVKLPFSVANCVPQLAGDLHNSQLTVFLIWLQIMLNLQETKQFF